MSHRQGRADRQDPSKYDGFYLQGGPLILDQVLDTLWHTIPKPRVTKEQFARAIRIWAGIHGPAIADAMLQPPPTAFRDKLEDVAHAADKLLRSLGSLGDELMVRLGAEARSAWPSGADTLEALRPVVEGETRIVAVRVVIKLLRDWARAAAKGLEPFIRPGPQTKARLKDLKRDALGELIVIWDRASATRTFGVPFMGFANAALAAVFGESAAVFGRRAVGLIKEGVEADLEGDCKEAIRQYKSRPQDFHLAYLPDWPPFGG